jgi:TonB family protein
MDASTVSNLLAWSLQVLAVVLVAGPLPWLLRLHDPSARHAYWRALLAACLLLPLLQPWHAAGGPIGVMGSDLTLLTGAPATTTTSGGLATTVVGSLRAARWPAALTLLLVAGALVRLGWLAAGLLHLRRLRYAARHARPGDEQPDSRLPRARAKYHYLEGLSQPVTFGLVRPVVLLPASLQSQPEEIRRAVIEHELWHVRRRDWLWVVAEESVRAVLWFHPAIAWVISQIQASREEVVDELTVLSTNARREYLQALLAFADEPPLFPAAPFARRRHLFHRMLLISREVAMSSRRVVYTWAAMAVAVVAGGAWSVSAFPLRIEAAAAGAGAVQGQTRDFRPGEARPASQGELDLRAAVTAQPTLNGYLALAKLQETRGAIAEAEATLMEATARLPNERAAYLALARFYTQTGRADAAAQAIEQAATMAPLEADAQHTAATFYEEIVRKDRSLDADTRKRYALAGIAAEDRALAIRPDYVDALVIKNILLREQAAIETDAFAQAQLVAEADELRNRAMELRKAGQMMNAQARGSVARNGMPPPPPPPPPPGAPAGTARQIASQLDGVTVDGLQPLRVGGNIKAPTKVRDVRPVYPPEALGARVQGVVILEAVIDASGSVRDARVLRSIPLLDQAAVDAVQQWAFTPTLLNGQPVPIIMTVTVNFTLE